MLENKNYWESDNIQFMRLLATMCSCNIPQSLIDEIAIEMSLSEEDVHSIFDRAQNKFDKFLETTDLDF